MPSELADDKSPGEKLAERLKRFTENLESGVPIEATEVRIEQTPDGPLTTRRPIVIGGRDAAH